MVNIYKRKTCWSSTNPNPEKIVLNLTTSVTDLKFNPSSEILAMASEVKENSVKLLHVPSMTVFSNFPSFNFNVKRYATLFLGGGPRISFQKTALVRQEMARPLVHCSD